MDNLDLYRQKLKDEEAARVSGVYAEEISIKGDQPNIMRIVDPSSAVEYFEAWMVCDDGEKRPFIVENHHQGKSILAELLGDRNTFYRGGILDSKIDEFKQKYYEYESADPELLLQVAYNNDKSNAAGSWKPTRRYMFGAVDRQPELGGDLVGQLWCVVNNHLKLFKMGSMGFESLMDVRDNDGNLEEYDINYKKTGSGMKNTTHSVMKAGDKIPNVVIGPITEGEKAYEKYILEDECALSTAREVLKYLEKTIARIDAVLGTNGIQQLQAQAAEETPLVTDAQATPAATAASPVAATGTAQPTNATPAAGTTRQATPPPTRSRVPVSDASTLPTVTCPFCKKAVPEEEKCKECGQRILEPCDKCKVPFLISLDTCPGCGQVYKVS